ncbi:MAG: hypothetical protein B6U87_01360 [Candidatus Aenigmarchaeota archaeon ex4484_52]|nr:MAG: hypothetical protein B6U87_01360 [Candidatus Aenigmarchaeota archaeon ex4484_52]
MNTSYDVITMGSATIDCFIETNMAEFGNEVCYPVGAKLNVNNLQFFIGGGGTNTAVSFARLGFKTAYLGKIGERFKDDILSLLKKEKINFLGKISKDMNDYSVILDTKQHNRTILTYKGASNKLKIKEINLSKLKTKWLYFTSMMQDSFETQIKLSDFAKKNNIGLCFNPSYYQIKEYKKELYKMIKNTTILVFNKQEAIELVNENSQKNIIDLIKKIYSLGPEIVCITDGVNSTHLYNGSVLYKFEPHKNIPLIERTGAGDAFASTLVAAIIKNKTLEFALSIAAINSESVIQNYGAKNILLSWRKCIYETKKNPIRILKHII